MKKLISGLLFLLYAAGAQAQTAGTSSLPVKQALALYNAISEPVCALTNGTTISVNLASCASNSSNGIDLGAITLTQNSTFAFPSGLPTGGNQKFGFRINHGAGSYTAQFASGYQFPSTSLTGGQPVLSTSGTDYVWCVSEEGSPPTTADCTASMLAMTAVSASIAQIQSINVSTGSASGATVASPSFSGVNSSDAMLCGLYSIGNTVTALSDSAGNTYTLTSPVQYPGGGDWYRTAYNVSLSGSPTTFTITTNASDSVRLICDDFRKTGGGMTLVGNVAPALMSASTSPSQSITPSATPSMLWSYLGPQGNAVASAGSGFVLGNNNAGMQSVSTEYAPHTGTSAFSIPWGLSASVQSIIGSFALN